MNKKTDIHVERAVCPLSFAEIDGVSVGNAHDGDALTGVTVLRFAPAATVAVEVAGGGPASRETPLLDPRRGMPVNAVVLSGGSAYGLAAADGVMQCLEEHGEGYDTGVAVVPIVCQSCIYDLSYGRSDRRPDAAMGYSACRNSLEGSHPESGNVGAGIGATVGKARGMASASKSGIGYAAAQIGRLQVGVAVVVNAYGDIYYEGRKLAGLLTTDRGASADAVAALFETMDDNLFTAASNTTLAVVVTNGAFDCGQLRQLATMASCGMARSIRPVFTTADGDTVYAASVGRRRVDANVNTAGALAAEVMERAIADAIMSSQISDEEFLSHVTR